MEARTTRRVREDTGGMRGAKRGLAGGEKCVYMYAFASLSTFSPVMPRTFIVMSPGAEKP